MACCRQRSDNTLFDKHISFQFVYEIEFKDVLRKGKPMDRHRRENRLRLQKLHVKHVAGIGPTDPISPRRYTLTHSDIAAELLLTIGPDCNESQICGWHARLMRDEVLAEWRDTDEGPALHIYCHVSGGFVFGSAQFRYEIFQDELPLVLEALRDGDRSFFCSASSVR